MFGWRSFCLIIAFWTLFGAVMATSLFYSPIRDNSPRIELIVFTFGGAYTWAALTLPLIRLTARFNLYGDKRGRAFVALCAIGLLLAVLVSAVVALAAALFLQRLKGGTLASVEGFWEIFRYRFLSDLLGCLLVFAAAVARDYFFRYQARHEEASALRAQLVESRLEVLRAQLNPHFLFNTLNAVSSLVDRDPRGVRRMIARLSDLLRHTLEETSEPELTLDRELDIVTRYLEIVEIRYQGRFQTSIDADPDILEALVPNLILQPLVENAIKHGVSLARGYGRVSITAVREGAETVLRVHDTGRQGARQSSSEHPGAARTGGFGLRQTRERLERLYGTSYSVDLRFDESGTTLELRLPYHTRPDPRPRSIPQPTSLPVTANVR